MRDFPQQCLRVHDLSVMVHLGLGEAERSHPQEVRFSVEMRFRARPGAMGSDRIDETFAYDELCRRIVERARTKPYRLIEHLGAETCAVVDEFAGGRAAIGVRVHKVAPPVPRLLGGASFSCGDFLI